MLFGFYMPCNNCDIFFIRPTLIIFLFLCFRNKHQDSPAASRSYNNERYKYRDNRRDEKDSRNRDYYRHYDYNNKKKHNKR